MAIGTAQALFFAIEEWDPGPMKGYIRRVRMRDIIARATRGCVIAGRPLGHKGQYQPARWGAP